MGKKAQISGVLLLISIAVFVVAWALNLSCSNNEDIPDQAWREIGEDYCDYAQNVNQLLVNFVEFMRNIIS